ncbi:MAG: PLD nuclease N-terminal domain-containing protein [Bacteroidota bacterium]
MIRFRALPVLFLGLAAVVLTGCGGTAIDVLNWRGGVCSLLHLIAVVYAFVQIANSRADSGSKLLWGLLVFFFPVGGLLIWYFFGPRDR